MSPWVCKIRGNFSPENQGARFVFEGLMSFTVWKIAAPIWFSKVRCHLRSRKLPHSLFFRWLDVIYGPEICRTHLFFEGSMPFTVWKIATRTSFSRVRCHLRYGKLPQTFGFRRFDIIYGPENCRAHLFFEGSAPFTVRKIAASTCFSKAQC